MEEIMSVLWVVGIALWAFNVIHVSAWIVFLWPLIPGAVFLVLGAFGVAVGTTFLGVGSLLNRRKRTNIRRF
jgi:hypothetical protein